MCDKEEILKDAIDELLNVTLFELENNDVEVMKSIGKITALEDKFSDVLDHDTEISKLLKEHFEDLSDLTSKQFRHIYVQGGKDMIELLVKSKMFQWHSKPKQKVDGVCNKTISDLYNGKIDPINDKIKKGGAYEQKGQEMCKYEAELLTLLDEMQKDIFNKFIKADNELIDISNGEQFTKGFKLGAKLAMETMYEDDRESKSL